MDVTDVATHLGKKYGGWVDSAVTYGTSKGKWIAIPGRLQRQCHQLSVSRRSRRPASQTIPQDTAGFLEMMKALKAKGTPGGMALGRASGDGNAWVHWALWSHGGNLVDKDDKVILNSPETVKALTYAKALSDAFVPGTALPGTMLSTTRPSSSAKSRSRTTASSIYAAAKAGADKDAKLKEIRDDMNHSLWPIGPAGKPTEFHIAYPMVV